MIPASREGNRDRPAALEPFCAMERGEVEEREEDEPSVIRFGFVLRFTVRLFEQRERERERERISQE